MSLVDKQSVFARNVASLIIFGEEHFKLTFGEAERTAEQAKLNAEKGCGIVDSLHCKRLAVDLHLYDLVTGAYLQDVASYEKLGVYWESLNPANRWGGKFKRVDSDHYEMQDL
jgi:hypothetical protein